MTFARTVLTIATSTLMAATLLAATPARAQANPIAWGPCPEVVDHPRARCGTIAVPMDYANPAGEKINVGFVTVAAAGTPKDTVFVNPGGPGGDVYSFAGATDNGWPAAFTDEFTIVGVQPRGLEGSTPLQCDSEGAAEQATLRDACNLARPNYTEAITTANTARDWEEVRKALGLGKISLMGVSYGTVLASVYTTEFPQNTNRVVLDSGVDADKLYTEASLIQVDGWTGIQHSFFGWVAAKNDAFGLGHTPYQVYRQWAEAIRRETGAYPPAVPPAMTQADLPPQSSVLGTAAVDALNAVERPRAEAESIITQQAVGQAAATSLLYAATMSLLIFPDSWGELAASINDPAKLNALVEKHSDAAEPSGDPEKIGADVYVNEAIACNEATSPARPELTADFFWHLLVTQDPIRSQAALSASGSTCEGTPPVTRLPAISGASLAVRPLQLQNTADPLTPYNSFWGMRAQMNSHLITVHGPGHGAFGAGNRAVDEAVLDYLRGGSPTVTDLPGYFG